MSTQLNVVPSQCKVILAEMLEIDLVCLTFIANRSTSITFNQELYAEVYVGEDANRQMIEEQFLEIISKNSNCQITRTDQLTAINVMFLEDVYDWQEYCTEIRNARINLIAGYIEELESV